MQNNKLDLIAHYERILEGAMEFRQLEKSLKECANPIELQNLLSSDIVEKLESLIKEQNKNIALANKVAIELSQNMNEDEVVSPEETVEFDVTNGKKLGLNLNMGARRFKVTSVSEGEQASKLGVQAGWIIMKVDGEEYIGDYMSDLEVLIAAARKTKKQQLVITFATPSTTRSLVEVGERLECLPANFPIPNEIFIPCEDRIPAIGRRYYEKNSCRSYDNIKWWKSKSDIYYVFFDANFQYKNLFIYDDTGPLFRGGEGVTNSKQEYEDLKQITSLKDITKWTSSKSTKDVLLMFANAKKELRLPNNNCVP